MKKNRLQLKNTKNIPFDHACFLRFELFILSHQYHIGNYYIVFVWSQPDGGKVEQKNNGISSRQDLMMP